MMKPVICAEGLSRHFGAIRAVDGLNIEVAEGTVFGFLGSNGSGKTTTIRMLLGLLHPTAGTARVLGYDVATQSEEIRLRSGALLEHSGIYERLSAEDNLDLFGRIYELSWADRRSRIRELLESFGLWDRRKEIAGSWSRGMKQKLAVARAMLHRPALIFLDEPTAGLDPVAAASLREELSKLSKGEGVTVFLTTHNLVEAERLCASVAVIRQGKLLAVGHPDTLRARSGSPRAEIVGRGFTPAVLEMLEGRTRSATVSNGRLVMELHQDTDHSALVRDLVLAGVEIEEVFKGKASLEDVFLTLMEEGEDK